MPDTRTPKLIITLVAAQFLVMLDSGILNVVLPSITTELGLTSSYRRHPQDCFRHCHRGAVVAVARLVGFAAVERRSSDPVLPIAALREPRVAGGRRSISSRRRTRRLPPSRSPACSSRSCPTNRDRRCCDAAHIDSRLSSATG